MRLQSGKHAALCATVIQPHEQQARAYAREQHLDGRDLDGAQIELVAPVAPLQERVYFQDHPSPLAPEQLMRVILMVLKAVEALEQPLVARQVEPAVKK